jgi:hypothetical protein
MAHSFVTLMEEDPNPVPLRVLEELREALAGVRWECPADHANTPALMRRLDILKRAALGGQWAGVPC